uniref:Probable ATP-dependent RNA helicase DDX46 (inferred by orthology to a zebrafish protein) n=1 Tax=Strongyloides venezuelensis TaxID=75913 RepID=A0A0K0G5Y4_STRVS
MKVTINIVLVFYRMLVSYKELATSYKKSQIATRVNMHQRPMGTGMVRGHVNKITFNIDNEIIITGAVDVPKCYETWGDANFHPILQNAIMKSEYKKTRRS